MSVPSGSPRQAGFGTYFGLVARQKFVVVLAVLACTGAAVALDASKPKVFSAQASLAFQDQSSALELAGTPASPATTADQLAAQGANSALDVSNLDGARQRLESNLGHTLSLTQLQTTVSAAAQTGSDLVVITAENRSASYAAAIANAVANNVVAQQRTAIRATLNAAIRTLRQRLRAIPNTAANQLEVNDYEDQLLHLQSLEAVDRPVQVAGAASVPTHSVSPKPVRDAVIAAIIGLILGLAIALVSDSFDRRLRGIEEIEREAGLRIVGKVPEATLVSGGPAAAAGRDSGADTQSRLEAFRILRTNVDSMCPPDGPRTILVTSAVAEEGKTTVAAWLALASVAAGHRTLVVDCDLRRPTLASRFDVAPKPGLVEYLRGAEAPSDILHEVDVRTLLNEHVEGTAPGQLVVIPGGEPTNLGAEMLGSPAFGAFLEEVRAVYSWIILDTSPVLPVADTLTILQHADCVLTCIRDGTTTADQVRGLREVLDAVNGVPAGVVATGFSLRQEQAYGYYSAIYSADVSGSERAGAGRRRNGNTKRRVRKRARAKRARPSA